MSNLRNSVFVGVVTYPFCYFLERYVFHINFAYIAVSLLLIIIVTFYRDIFKNNSLLIKKKSKDETFSETAVAFRDTVISTNENSEYGSSFLNMKENPLIQNNQKVEIKKKLVGENDSLTVSSESQDADLQKICDISLQDEQVWGEAIKNLPQSDIQSLNYDMKVRYIKGSSFLHHHAKRVKYLEKKLTETIRWRKLMKPETIIERKGDFPHYKEWRDDCTFFLNFYD